MAIGSPWAEAGFDWGSMAEALLLTATAPTVASDRAMASRREILSVGARSFITSAEGEFAERFLQYTRSRKNQKPDRSVGHPVLRDTAF